MTLAQMEKELKEARRLRDNTSVKICDYKRKGKDTKELEYQMETLRHKVNFLTESLKEAKKNPTPAPKPNTRKTKAQPKVEVKIYAKQELEKCRKDMDQMLVDNDWTPGYQMRCSECMFIPKVGTKVVDNAVELQYTLQYKTKNHRVERQVKRQFTPDNIKNLRKYIDKMEVWVMNNSGDMDDKNIVFGPRFNMVQFDKRDLASQGWVIYK